MLTVFAAAAGSFLFVHSAATLWTAAALTAATLVLALLLIAIPARHSAAAPAHPPIATAAAVGAPAGPPPQLMGTAPSTLSLAALTDHSHAHQHHSEAAAAAAAAAAANPHPQPQPSAASSSSTPALRNRSRSASSTSPPTSTATRVMSLQGHPPLHPATQNGSSSQAQAEELMDQFMFAEMTPPPAASSASQQGASASGGVSRPGGLSNLHPILTSNLRGPAHVPSSPVSPMLSSLDMLAGGASMTSPRQVASNKAFLSAVTGAPQQNAAKEPAVALTRAVSDEDAAMEQRAEQEAEMMSREEEEEAMAAAAAAASGEDHLAGGPLTVEEEEMLRQEEEGDESDWLEEEESEEAPPATPAGESAQLSREEQQALEEKTKQRKKAAEMRYLVNSMYRCADCMQPPTDMQLGFDEHAPPLRPAARPSHGPGSHFCCVGPALADALPPDFPLDLIPLTHSYLLTEAPSRSFLTTPPLPAQGTIQAYILKTNTKFELYLEMKNQTDFVQMRADKEKREQAKRQRAEEKARKASAAAGSDAGSAESKAMDEGAPAEAVVAASAPTPTSAVSAAASSTSHPPSQPVLTHSQSMPVSLPPPLPVTSLDDSELGLHSDADQRGAMSVTETPDVLSPTQSLDYEKLFPERPELQAPSSRRTRSATNTPVLRPQPTPASAAMQTFQRLSAGGRRMSEPAFNLGQSLMASSSASSSTAASAHASPLQRRRSLRRQQQGGSSNATPQSTGRRLSGGSSAIASALPPSASNLHLHQTRTNAINSMLKQHAEGIIAEGKDVFLLCAQRKRSWTGNHYIISNDRDNIRADGPSFFGKLKSNFGGTEFTVTDNGTKSPNRKCIEQLPSHMYPTYNAAAQHAAGRPSVLSAGGVGGAVSSWLTGASAASAPPHVRHELACVLYDHFFEHTGSPIRIKVLLPNRAFDLQTEAAVGGSIIKQYKAECERAEKAKAEADAKAAAAAEARRVQEARENRAKESSIVSSNQASVSSATASASDVDNAHMSDAEHSAVGAPQPPPPAAAASASSSSSASVAPLPDVAAGDEDPVAKCVETYENLRPVWHDGMNAYVLHFDGHRVREKSVKNFKLVRTIPDPAAKTPGATIQKTVLQFGRVLDRNVFVMDYAYPLSPLAAFAICLSSIDPKLAV